MTAQNELFEAERQLYDAMVRKDVADLDGMLHPELIFVHSTALVESKAVYLKSVADGHFRYASIVPHPGIVHVDGDIALIADRVDMNQSQRLQVVLVWQRVDGRWLLLHRQATEIRS